jgi:hypothetical protein
LPQRAYVQSAIMYTEGTARHGARWGGRACITVGQLRFCQADCGHKFEDEKLAVITTCPLNSSQLHATLRQPVHLGLQSLLRCSPLSLYRVWGAELTCVQAIGCNRGIGTLRPPCNLPPNVVTIPPPGGGGIAQPNVTLQNSSCAWSTTLS